MRTLSPDTRPEAEKILLELIRKAPLFRRLEMVASLVKTTRELCWRGICERYPSEPTPRHIERFVILLYGDQPFIRQVLQLIKKKKDLER